MMVSSGSNPLPPYSVGTGQPSTPNSAQACQPSASKVSSRSCSATLAPSVAANRSTRLRSATCSVVSPKSIALFLLSRFLGRAGTRPSVQVQGQVGGHRLDAVQVGFQNRPVAVL